MRPLAAFLRLPLRQQGMALEAAAWLVLAWVAVHHVPMRHWRGGLNTAGEGARGHPGQRSTARDMGRMVRRVARRLPFEAACLPRAMAVQWMLRRRGVPSRLVFGVWRTATGRPAHYHAWLTVGDERVVGGRNADGFTALPPLSPRRAGAPRERARGT